MGKNYSKSENRRICEKLISLLIFLMILRHKLPENVQKIKQTTLTTIIHTKKGKKKQKNST